ncbi:hypothetical protein BDR26DRAFT_804258 [Obelidium mucronatum]|nr:hypothetical protein BDR26DRAFT_804258 [Obelidium mucronatum]
MDGTQASPLQVDPKCLRNRVVIHVDLDSFYAQVEQVRLGLPREQPLAVQQWQLLVAVNYAARAKGLKKMSTVAEAKAACPEIMLVHTASIPNGDTEARYHPDPKYDTHKISLDVYRHASKKIMELLSRFSPKFQRASVDEAYLDMTDIVNAKINEMHSEGRISMDETSNMPIVDWTSCPGTIVGLTDGAEPPAQPLTTLGWGDLQLRIGSDLCTDIRAAVANELHYTCSAGISHNKTLSKLCSALNKPDKQTILLHDHVLSFLQPLPFQKIKNLGGKLGTEIEDIWNVETCGQVWQIPLATLQLKLGEASGMWVHDIVRGVCTEAVMQTQLQKSIGANKAFRNPPLKSMEDVFKWIEVLACEIFLRLKEEYETNTRWPKSFSMSYRIENRQTIAKSAPMPSRLRTVAPDILAKLALSLMGSQSIVPCRALSLGCNSFIKEDANAMSVAKFFKKVDDAIPLGEHPPILQDRPTDGAISDVTEKPTDKLLLDVDIQEQQSILKTFEADETDHCIQCDKCKQFVKADDVSLEEHQDFHVAMTLHREITADVLNAGRGSGLGKKKSEKGKQLPQSARKKPKTEHCVGSEITNFFKPK